MVCQECKYILGGDDPSPCVATNKQKRQFDEDCEKFKVYNEEDFGNVEFEEITLMCQKTREDKITKRKDDDFCKKCPLREGCL